MRLLSRLVMTAVVGTGLSSFGWGQNAPIRSSPLPPLQQQWLREGSPPVQEAPSDSIAPGNNLQDQAPAPSATGPGAPADFPNVWLPQGTAKLQALDKVNAQTSQLTIKVGQSGTFGSLTIMVKSCMVRPSDQPADAAAYLDVTDSHPDSPGFEGWMLQDEPSVSMMQHPIYDLRVVGCV